MLVAVNSLRDICPQLPSFDAPAIYAADKVSARICTEMHNNGFAFDAARAHKIAAHLIDIAHAKALEVEDAVGRKLARNRAGEIIDGDDMRRAFFEDLGAPPFYWGALSGRPKLDAMTLQAYASRHNKQVKRAALALIAWRSAQKFRSTFVLGVFKEGAHKARAYNDVTRRVHPGWTPTGAVTGRWSCSNPNLQNLPRLGNDPTADAFPGGIRSLYHAPPGRALVIFDYSQLEMRMAAYVTGDDVMIAATQASDIHSYVAEMLFGEAFANADKAARKSFRSLAKNAGFAVCYMAGEETVYDRIVASGEGAFATPRRVAAMLTALQRSFRVYYRWQAEYLLQVVASGYIQTPLSGRRCWVGHDPEPPKTANHPIQGGAADLINTRLPIYRSRLQIDHPGAILVAQVHDSVVTECDAKAALKIVELCKEIFSAPILIKTSGRSLEATFPVDTEIVERWS